MLTVAQAIELLKNKPVVSKTIKRWRDVYYGISLHTTGAVPSFVDASGTRIEPPNYFGAEYQTLFERYLLNRHPRESPITREWRYSQYRPFTKDPFMRIIEVATGAIFQDSQFTIEANDKKDHEYIWGNNFSGYDLPHFFEWTFQHACEDPNGYFVRLPKQPHYATTTERIEPDVWFVNTKDILHQTKDEIFFMRDEIAWLINTVAIFRFRKNETPNQAEEWVNADRDGFYAHGFGYIPADHAGGIWNTQGFYDSYLAKAKAVADEFISSKSAEQLVNKEASHPFIVMASEDCPTCSGAGSIQEDCDDCPGGVELKQCIKCRGTGQVSNNPGERMHVPREFMDRKLVDIISPDTSINAHHKENNKDLLWQLLDALHLTKVDEAQSGVAKTIDQERLYQWLTKIANDLFDRVIYNCIRDFLAYRNVRAVDGVALPAGGNFAIVKPTQFQIKTAADLLLEFEAGTKANVPAFIRVKIMEDYVDKQFGGDALMKRKANIIGQMDPICTYSVQERQSMLNTAVGQDALRFNIELPGILDGIVRDKTKDWFVGASYEEIKTAVDTAFKALPKIEMPAPSLPTSAAA